MSTGTTLYYPFIHPRDSNYLKTSLIYWDRVRRIVPQSLTHGDHVLNDDQDGQLLTERDLLVFTRPEPYEEAAALRVFTLKSLAIWFSGGCNPLGWLTSSAIGSQCMTR